MAAGEAADPDVEDIVRHGIMEAIDAGHDPREVRQWALADIMHYSQHTKFS